VKQIGCIHTSQGLEVDYIGVIIGPDMAAPSGSVCTYPEKRSRMDKSLNGYKKALKAEPTRARGKADAIIRNTYRTLMTRGMKGCYVYCTDRALTQHLRSRISRSEPPHESAVPLAMVAEDAGKYETYWMKS
jgi:DUF2075 family protein